MQYRIGAQRKLLLLMRILLVQIANVSDIEMYGFSGNAHKLMYPTEKLDERMLIRPLHILC